MDKKTKLVIGIISIGLFSLLLLLAYTYGKKSVETKSSLTTASLPSYSPSPSLVITPSPEVSSSPSASPLEVDETELIKQAVYDLTGLTAEQAEVTVSQQVGNFATGGVKEYEAVGGAYWLAAKTASGWIGVYDGQSQPECAVIETYAFPVGMVPECLNSSGEVVSR